MRNEGRVVAALSRRSISVQFRRAQLLMPTFVLPLMLLAVIASGTSAAQDLPQFPGVNSYLGFVVAGTLIQGALLAGLTSGAAMAGDVEFGFFDRLLTAPVRRTSLVLGRQAGTLVLSVLQSTPAIRAGSSLSSGRSASRPSPPSGWAGSRRRSPCAPARSR